ncbi:hypothetical protein AQ477_26210 [Burkholderia thailandensis]|nr:hypothetical protein AQ477_26210 [Burkholderia thailandensis]KXF59659.1 hypothetical protein AQ476_19150 [Burkholderia thailandensis]PNE78306.1 hypothetical protein A8H37_08950 [Burkholderia thailandensis]
MRAQPAAARSPPGSPLARRGEAHAHRRRLTSPDTHAAHRAHALRAHGTIRSETGDDRTGVEPCVAAPESALAHPAAMQRQLYEE